MQREFPAGVSQLFIIGHFLVACAPARVMIREEPPGHLSVAWSNVDLGDYYVAFVKSDDGLEVHCNTSLTQCNFPSECGFTYFISVFAYNKAGQSPLGDIFNYTTGESNSVPVKGVLCSWAPLQDASPTALLDLPTEVIVRAKVRERISHLSSHSLTGQGNFGFVDPSLTKFRSEKKGGCGM